MLNLGDKVLVKASGVIGIVEIIDPLHPRIAVRVQVIDGNTSITDYYADELEVIVDDLEVVKNGQPKCEYLKLKEDVPFSELEKYGFEKDATNCEDPEDHYYWLNNYYAQVHDDFRITVNMNERSIDVLCLCEETGLHNISNLKPLYDLIINNLVEVKTIQ